MACAAAGADPVTLKYSTDDELRTSLRWVDIRPGVTLPAALPAAAVETGRAPPESARKLSPEVPIRHAEAAVGKLLFIKPGGEAGSCTATFVAGKSILITAARCIMGQDGTTNSDFVFAANWSTPAQQIYPVTCAVVPGEWLHTAGSDAWAFNYAFLRTGRDSTFGGLGVTNALTPASLVRVGYADGVAEGRQMQLSKSNAAMLPGRLVGTGWDPLAAGSSGNPWIRNAIVYSLTSHYDPAYPDILLGPRFTGVTMQLLAHLRKEC